MTSLSKLFAHMAWADARTLESLRAMREAPPQALDLLAHLLGAEHAWLRRVEMKSAAYTIWPTIGLDECERLSRANHAGFASLLARADRLALASIVTYVNSSGNTFDTPLEDILVHVAQHGMYHRGQVALLVRASGGAPIPTDYIVHQRELVQRELVQRELVQRELDTPDARSTPASPASPASPAAMSH